MTWCRPLSVSPPAGPLGLSRVKDRSPSTRSVVCPVQPLCSHRGGGDRRGSFRPHLCSSLQLAFGVFCLFLRQICCRSQPSFGFSILLCISYSVCSKLKVWPAGSVCLAYSVKKGLWDPVALEPGTEHLEPTGLWGLRERRPCFAPADHSSRAESVLL